MKPCVFLPDCQERNPGKNRLRKRQPGDLAKVAQSKNRREQIL